MALSVLNSMAKLSDVLHNDPVRALIWSQTGGGKTTLIARAVEFEEFWPMYFADWDLRIASLRATLPTNWLDRIDVDPYRDVSIGGEAFAKWEAKLQKLEKEGFKSAVIDSMTFQSRGIMNRVLMLDQKSITTNPQLQHYLTLQSTQEQIISQLCSKKLHVFVTCHEDNQRDEILGRTFKGLDLNGKSAGRIPGFFNEIWHCEVTVTSGGTKFQVRTRSDQLYMARTSFKSVAAVENQEDIWKKIVTELRARPAVSAAPTTSQSQPSTVTTQTSQVTSQPTTVSPGAKGLIQIPTSGPVQTGLIRR